MASPYISTIRGCIYSTEVADDPQKWVNLKVWTIMYKACSLIWKELQMNYSIWSKIYDVIKLVVFHKSYTVTLLVHG